MSSRSAPTATEALRKLEQRLVDAVARLEAAERAGDLALYRSDGLMFDLRRMAAAGRRALAETRARLADQRDEASAAMPDRGEG
jgi:hypothetical protein